MRALWLSFTAISVIFFTTNTSAQEEGLEDDPLAELAALGDAMMDEGPEGGGSIRAKKEVDTAVTKRKKDGRNVEAKVEEVKLGKFPRVAVKVRVSRPAKTGKGAGLAKNDTLVIIPLFKVKKGKIVMEDDATRLNAGAFYLQRGDKVMIRLGDNPKGKLWKAEYIERK